MQGKPPGRVATLPQEIIDAIIDQVAPPRQLEYIRSSNTPSLRACALVSKSFLPRSQKNIFRQIILCPPAEGRTTGRNTPDRLHAVIQSSPWLSSSVESVVIACVDEGSRSLALA
ncbi:hypothetical protein BDZ89DRAFT_392557 [Hymenopellis radicata]|nr:hypothetical protein BDZ89DRAFT_392557 [Hymenopellis radicata]